MRGPRDGLTASQVIFGFTESVAFGHLSEVRSGFYCPVPETKYCVCWATCSIDVARASQWFEDEPIHEPEAKAEKNADLDRLALSEPSDNLRCMRLVRRKVLVHKSRRHGGPRLRVESDPFEDLCNGYPIY